MIFLDERHKHGSLMRQRPKDRICEALLSTASCAVLVLTLSSGCISNQGVKSGSTENSRGPALAGEVVEAPPHIVFYLHGFRDDGKMTFGALPDLIDATFNGSLANVSGIEKNLNVRHKLLQYPSMSDSDDTPALSAFDFAKLINTQIISYLVEEGERDKADPSMRYRTPVSINTPYTIVAHSQGGMVAATYLNTCFKTKREIDRGDNDRCSYDAGVRLLTQLGLTKNIDSEHYLDHLEMKSTHSVAPNFANLLTVATPFWGSPVASAAEQDIAPLLKLLKEQLPSVQLQNLAIGSRTSTVSRVWMVNRYGAASEPNWTLQTPWVSRFPSGLKIYNLAGQLGPLMDQDAYMDGKKRALKEALKPDLAELDFVVANQESRTDFIYQIENSDPSRPSLKGRTRYVSAFVPINAAHIGIFGYPAVASVPNVNYLNNPTFLFLKRILMLSVLPGTVQNQSIGSLAAQPIEFTTSEKRRLFVKKISNFTSEVKLITPIGYHRRFLVRPSQVKMSADEPTAFATLKRPRSILVATAGENTSALQINDHFYQTYFHTGSFTPEASFKPQTETTDELFAKHPDGYKLNYSFDIAGFETKTMSAQVMPSFTSYSEVYLKPYFPVPMNTSNNLIAVRSGRGNSITSLSLSGEGHLVPTVKPKSAMTEAESKMLDLCHVGIAAEGSLPESDRSAYLPDHAIAGKDVNPLVVFTNFTDEFPDRNFRFETGETLEVLGRRSTGHVDTFNGFTRGCVLGEVAPDCNSTAYDRYLVTSASLRDWDHVTKSELGIDGTKGLRWIEVNVVDMLTSYRYAVAGVIDQNHSQRGSVCLNSESFKTYLEPQQARKMYYPTSRLNRLLNF